MLIVCCWIEIGFGELQSDYSAPNFSLYFKVTEHQIFIDLLLIKAFLLAVRLTPPTVLPVTTRALEIGGCLPLLWQLGKTPNIQSNRLFNRYNSRL